MHEEYVYIREADLAEILVNLYHSLAPLEHMFDTCPSEYLDTINHVYHLITQSIDTIESTGIMSEEEYEEFTNQEGE